MKQIQESTVVANFLPIRPVRGTLFWPMLWLALWLASALTMAQGAELAELDAALTPEQAKVDARVISRTLSTLHPALTKYQSQAAWDAVLSRFETRAQGANRVSEMILAAGELTAAIRCGHTWINPLNQKGAAKALLLDAANKLPLMMTLVEDRWLVLASADPEVAPGDEILAINGMDATTMVATMRPYLRADGSSDGKRMVQLNHDREDYSQMDLLWPLLSPPKAGRYALKLRQAKSGRTKQVEVNAISMQERASKGLRHTSGEWTFRIDGDTGYLTMPTWAFWEGGFDWKAFLAQSFAELNAKHATHLIIDIRQNEGGDDAIAAMLLAHLSDKPIRYRLTQSTTSYERVPYNLARYLETWDYGFFDRTGQVEAITEGTAKGKFRFLPNSGPDGTIEPVATPFRGKTFVLISAENSSATFVFAARIQELGLATLVGQATGGNERGLNGGQLAWATAPHSGVSVDIPLLAATYTETTPDRAVQPDLVVRRSFAARKAGVDQELTKVSRMIQKDQRR